VLPRAADADVAEVERRVVDDEDRVLRGDVVEDVLDRAALIADPVIDIAR
jgi:hypothetical protein